MKKTFQTIIGFGAAFTDAASATFAKLPMDSQEEFLRACFDPVKGNLKDKETFFRVWRNGQSLRYTGPPNATITFLFEPTKPS